MNPKWGLATVPQPVEEKSQKQIEQLKAYIDSLHKTISTVTKSSVR
jgi:hypothetical protein